MEPRDNETAPRQNQIGSTTEVRNGTTGKGTASPDGGGASVREREVPKPSGEEEDIFEVSKSFRSVANLSNKERREYADKIDQLYEGGTAGGTSLHEEDIAKIAIIASQLGFRRGENEEDRLEDVTILQQLYPKITDEQLPTLNTHLSAITPSEITAREELQRLRENLDRAFEGKDPGKEREFIERAELLGKDIPEDRTNTFQEAIDILSKEDGTLKSEDEFSGEDKDALIKKLQDSHISKEEAKILLEVTNLSEPVREEIVSQLQESPERKADDEGALPPELKQQIETKAIAMEEEVKKRKNALVRALGALPEHIAEKIEHWEHQLHEFFHPDDPLKTWATRGGLVTWWAILAAFILLMGYMALLNKTGRTK